MKVEIDISDMAYDSLYTDERCNRIQRILENQEEYSDFLVKRQRGNEEPSKDIYIVMDASENYLIWMYGWEVDALDDSEILDYFIVTNDRDDSLDPTLNWMVSSACSIALFMSLVFTYVVIDSSLSFLVGPMIISFIAGIILYWIYHMKNKVYVQGKKEKEIELMTRHPLFFEAIRKFAALPDISEVQRKEYQKRLQEIESKMRD